MEFDFLKPLSNEVLELINGLNSQHLGSKIVLHTSEQFPDLNKIKIAIIGVLDNRGDSKAISDVDLTAIRKEFYSLYPGNWEASIADLGDIYFDWEQLLPLLKSSSLSSSMPCLSRPGR
mgnify:CR=1 FL=1